ncbi:hypothetical protein RZP54_25335 [Raoultella ornithinolytica]|uniref:hypothetical protein n=1 Tax=Klebsiella/Raoultella group TaxID=2890311 RepID=UPI0010ED8B79|nr:MULTISPECIES: hypothetical protein [Klebsiella/Raoultella group]MDI0348231.1 hypothetical protein [Raoultella ornithinolytica]MDI0400327.1 hypothetical protein [Raoultella ornithinolytica]MDI0427363.1 hypothetical protein [Raoultella ornithinolytica]MDI0446270.1 hypothetical protein [Raoultella ornithinolytica]MDI0451955.1 hypothetical protein [Raoultella ornithinolytica]
MMLVNFDPLRELENDRRSHPWGKTSYDERAGFYSNFIENPQLITEVLEDFKPYESKPAVQTFYSFLKWINGPDSSFETNDCALRDGVIMNTDPLFKFTHKIDGRVEFFLRQHQHNCNKNVATWLMRMSSLYLQVERTNFFNSIIDIQLAPTDFIMLPANQRDGYRIRLVFNAYGDGELDTWEALNCTFDSIFKATKRLNQAITEGNSPTFP